jgi:hypothetical protein
MYTFHVYGGVVGASLHPRLVQLPLPQSQARARTWRGSVSRTDRRAGRTSERPRGQGKARSSACPQAPAFASAAPMKFCTTRQRVKSAVRVHVPESPQEPRALRRVATPQRRPPPPPHAPSTPLRAPPRALSIKCRRSMCSRKCQTGLGSPVCKKTGDPPNNPFVALFYSMTVDEPWPSTPRGR